MAEIFPIGGGKGGSGKSFLVASIGNQLAKAGKKTLLIDADLGAANLHTVLGVPAPAKGLSSFLNRDVDGLADTVMETHQSGLFLIGGAGDSLEIANLPYAQKMKLLRAIRELPYEFILVDLGGGTSFNTMDLFMISDTGIFVTTPEPTCIENTYRFARALCLRKMKQLFKMKAFPFIRKTLDRYGRRTLISPAGMLDILRQEEPRIAEIMEDILKAFKFKLIVNQFRKQDNAYLGAQICQMCEKHLELKIDFLGNVQFDNRVHDAVCGRVPFLDRYPYTQTALDLKAIYEKIMTPPENNHLMAGHTPSWSLASTS